MGGKWFALRDVTWGWEALTQAGSHELNVPRFFLCRNGRLYGELGAAIFPGVQPVTDGGQLIQRYAAKCTVLGEVRLGSH